MKYAADTEVLEREVRTLRRDHRLVEDALRHAEVERDRYREALERIADLGSFGERTQARAFARDALTDSAQTLTGPVTLPDVDDWEPS